MTSPVVVFFTLTDRASTIPSNIRGCQSGTWSRKGTKVNGSHHGHNPLLRPTGIQITTKSYATLQAMAPTNSKTAHQTSFTPYREQPRSTRIVVTYHVMPHAVILATRRANHNIIRVVAYVRQNFKYCLVSLLKLIVVALSGFTEHIICVP